ncbi:MAG: EAL domain-containing protein [Phreatobacter sp.]|uniref:EAL domain-containing protein n=1 Tax=Phreatobacter sp. TaxID=1966341 RepID=UPI0027358B84|nr:EAL domain-containing protein [Phreatobacter sp.]MDP2802882.1 EAL domain-containing protein [Phreatobacter sp.]
MTSISQRASVVAPTRRPGRLQQIVIVFGSTVAASLLAAFAAWLLLVAISQDRIASVGHAVLNQLAALDLEARQTLDLFNRQPAAFCSAAELEQLRERVFLTRFIKDIGRVRGGALHCSAALQTLPSPAIIAPPDLVSRQGLSVHAAEALLVVRHSRAPILGEGEANVVLDPDALAHDVLVGVDFVAGYLGADGRFVRLFGKPLALGGAELLAGRPVDRDGTLFHPACDGDRSICVVTSLPKSEILRLQWPIMAAGGWLGTIIGLGLGLLIIHRQTARRSLPEKLKRAIAQGSFDVVYQPIVRLADRSVVGAEALIRWRDENGDQVPPATFIPVAEEAGLIGQITHFMLRRVMFELAGFIKSHPDFCVSINISASDLDDPDFYETLASMLERTHIEPRCIILELTEHAATRRDQAIDGTRLLRARGHRIYIDDFGTGFSNLSYLNELSIDALKVDRSFTVTVGAGKKGSPVLPQILDMARALEIDLVVEGIETEEQAAWFVGQAVAYAQGWLFYRPVDAQALQGIVAEQRQRSEALGVNPAT